jgi:hypothetical protein
MQPKRPRCARAAPPSGKALTWLDAGLTFDQQAVLLPYADSIATGGAVPSAASPAQSKALQGVRVDCSSRCLLPVVPEDPLLGKLKWPP